MSRRLLCEIFKNFFFLSFFFLRFLSATLSYQEISQLVQSQFSPDTPGLNWGVVPRDKGASFELESALYLEKYFGDKVIGLNLDIIVLNKNPVFVPLGNSSFQLKTTEYDVVTSHGFVVECKSTRRPDTCKKMTQFFKERDMLRWFARVYKGWEEGRLFIDFHFNIKEFCIMVLNGESTAWRDVYISSHWVKGKTTHECAGKWLRIIKILASSSLFIMFKNGVSHEFGKKLSGHDFEYVDNVTY